MPPIDRRRRRRRLPRVGAVAVAGVLAGAVVLALLVGGLLEVRPQSVGYERSVDRSYAAQVRVLVAESDQLGREFRALLARVSRDDRTTLEAALDTLVRSTASVADEAGTAASPAPSGPAGADVSAAMADRAAAVRTFRMTVDQLLGMAPLAVVGARDPAALPLTPLSAGGAAAEFGRVGALLRQGDASYAAGRRALRAAPGSADLPPSVWSGRTAAWASSGTRSLVDALTSSPTLAAVHQVALVAHALSLTPAPVPSSPGGSSSASSVLPPTGRIRIGVVVADDGNVAERGIVVRATVTRAGGSARPAKVRRVALAAHSSVSVTIPPVPVVPGGTYTIVVAVDPPLANVPGTVTSDTVSVRVAPPAAPTVAQLLPDTGRERGGTGVTVLGSGFTWVRRVTFGNVPVRFRVVSSSEITAVAPPGAGTVAVRVVNPGGVSASSSADRFHYRPK
ncbi:MAG TPA: IPT/TIG domain-containing protein [Acidimicrobiales bacterium]|nr:IPT/TIG domain-containing protein [Acidimicrobiales bacterium]